MRIRTMGLAALMAGSMMGDGLAQQTLEGEIQQEEAPGSQIELGVGRPGQVIIGRERNLRASPVEMQDQILDVPDDPDTPDADDPVDAELPGEGPEDLSGPDDDDSLPD